MPYIFNLYIILGNFKKALDFFVRLVYNTQCCAGVMELVDVVDSKSTAGDSVPVRVRSPAPPKRDILSDVSFFIVFSLLAKVPQTGYNTHNKT